MSGVTVVTSGGNVNVTTSQKVISLTPSGWDEQIAEYGRGYHFPLSTQTTSYRSGDEASIEASTFASSRVSNSLKMLNSLTDILTLGNTNSFGNTSRFTDSEGGQVFGAGNGSIVDYKIDHYTGLGLLTTAQAGIEWNDVIDNGLAFSYGGFDDWFALSTPQYCSLFNLEPTNTLNYTPLNMSSTTIWTSTTDPALTTNGHFIRPTNHKTGLIDSLAKSGNSLNYYYGRKHF